MTSVDITLTPAIGNDVTPITGTIQSPVENENCQSQSYTATMAPGAGQAVCDTDDYNTQTTLPALGYCVGSVGARALRVVCFECVGRLHGLPRSEGVLALERRCHPSRVACHVSVAPRVIYVIADYVVQ